MFHQDILTVTGLVPLYKAAMVKSESAVNIAAVCLSGSTVPVIVIIVVKYRACLLVSRLIIGI